MAKVKIHIIYCGAWGYDSKFHALKKELDAAFGADIEVTGEGTPTRTGYLEVQIVGGKVLHSKKNGDGFVDTKAKTDKIMQGIREALAAAKG